jgi:hypothetical protein
MLVERRLKQTQPLAERLSLRAQGLRKEAKGMPHGIARERLVRLARQAETGAQVSAWLRSSRSRPPVRGPQEP